MINSVGSSEDNMATTDIVSIYYVKMYRYDYINN